MCRFDLAHAVPAAPQAAADADTASDDAFDWMDALVDFLDEEPAPSSTTTGSSGACLSSGVPVGVEAKQEQQEQQQQPTAPQTLGVPQQPQQLAGMVLPGACYGGAYASFAGVPIGGFSGLVAPVAGPVVAGLVAQQQQGGGSGSGASCATAPAPVRAAAPVPSACSGRLTAGPANGACAMPASRARRLANEDKVERTKQKRRESAQRSRERRAAYMKALEEENDGLRRQVAQLQEALRMVQQHGAALPVVAAQLPMPSIC